MTANAMQTASRVQLAKALAFMCRKNLTFRVLSIRPSISIGDEHYGTAIQLPDRLADKFPLGAEVRAFKWEDRGQLGLTSSFDGKFYSVPLASIDRLLIV
jgi:hypothetical protein